MTPGVVPVEPGAEERAVTLVRPSPPLPGVKDRESILAEAERLINGPRNRSYGSWVQESDRIARLWSIVLGVEVTDSQVTACMALLKIERALHSGERDSLVDLAGYAALWGRVLGL